MYYWQFLTFKSAILAFNGTLIGSIGDIFHILERSAKMHHRISVITKHSLIQSPTLQINWEKWLITTNISNNCYSPCLFNAWKAGQGIYWFTRFDKMQIEIETKIYLHDVLCRFLRSSSWNGLAMCIWHVFMCSCVPLCVCACMYVGGWMVSCSSQTVCAEQLTDTHTHTRSEQKAPPGSSDISAHTHTHTPTLTYIYTQHTWHALVWYSVLTGSHGCVCGDRGETWYTLFVCVCVCVCTITSHMLQEFGAKRSGLCWQQCCIGTSEAKTRSGTLQ